MARLCQVFGVHRSSFKYWNQRVEVINPEQVLRLSKVKELFSASNGSAGSRSIATMATAQGVKMSRYLAAKCMEKLGFVSCQQPSHAYKKSGREHVEIPNLLDRQFAVTQPNQVWCGDITYVWAGGRWHYLAAVLDLHTRRVVGWAMSDKPDAELAIKALEMAYQQRGCPSGVLFHSDQGSQYGSRAYTYHLPDLPDLHHGIIKSICRLGLCTILHCVYHFHLFYRDIGCIYSSVHLH